MTITIICAVGICAAFVAGVNCGLTINRSRSKFWFFYSLHLEHRIRDMIRGVEMDDDNRRERPTEREPDPADWWKDV